MTSLTQNAYSVGGTFVWQRLSDVTASLAQRRAQQQAYRSTVSQLTAMSHHDLTDIGIHPADIHTIARQAAYGA